MNSRKKLCMITLYYWPFNPGRGTRHPKVITELLRNDFDLTVITSSYNINDHNRNSKYIEYDDGIKIVRLPLAQGGKNGFIGRALSETMFAFRSVFAAIKYVDRKSLVFAAGPPHFFGLIIPFIKLFKSSPCLALLTDMFPDVLFDMGIVKSEFLKRIVKHICIKTYKDADHIMVITNQLRERLIEYSIEESKISVIELAVDTQIFSPAHTKEYLELGIPHLKNKFVVLYSGSFNTMYDFDILLNAARYFALKLENNDIQFLIRGDGEQRNYLLKSVSELAVKNVTVLGPVNDTETVVSFINSASVCVVPVRDSKSIHMTHPSKIFEYWACEKPVICTSRDELADLIERSKAGCVVEPGDVEGMINSILSLYQDKEKLRIMGMEGRNFVKKYFSYSHIKPKLVALMDSLSYSK